MFRLFWVIDGLSVLGFLRFLRMLRLFWVIDGVGLLFRFLFLYYRCIYMLLYNLRLFLFIFVFIQYLLIFYFNLLLIIHIFLQIVLLGIFCQLNLTSLYIFDQKLTILILTFPDHLFLLLFILINFNRFFHFYFFLY